MVFRHQPGILVFQQLLNLICIVAILVMAQPDLLQHIIDEYFKIMVHRIPAVPITGKIPWIWHVGKFLVFGNLSDKLSLPLIEKINEKLSKGEDASEYLAPAVLDYIQTRGMYGYPKKR